MMIPSARPGTVYLVGAGPGSPDLITLRGLALVRQADVVVYDRLVHPDLVEEAHPEAARLYVGKAPGRHACPQEEINDLLVAHARKGHVVTRLKGGDPFVFGRGGEEALALGVAGVPFEVVPGVTSAVSAPAFAGIPVTHRGVSTSFTVVTGHTCGSASSEGGTSGVDWGALSGVGTLVILMGLGRLGRIARELTAQGRSPETPAAVVCSGSTEEQVVVEGTLSDIAERAEGLRGPGTIVVGEVVRLRRALAWFAPGTEEAGGDGFPSSDACRWSEGRWPREHTVEINAIVSTP